MDTKLLDVVLDTDAYNEIDNQFAIATAPFPELPDRDALAVI